MTLEEIYLDFRTAPVGSLSPASAMSETALFASQRVLPAAAAGTAIGTGINYLIETYDPSLSDAIGGTIAGSIEAAQAAVLAFTPGPRVGDSVRGVYAQARAGRFRTSTTAKLVALAATVLFIAGIYLNLTH